MYTYLSDMYGNRITPDLDGVKSEQHAVRRALIDIGFEYEPSAFYFSDVPSHKIFYIKISHLNSFADIYNALDESRQEPELNSEAVGLCEVIRDRVKRFERYWRKSLLLSYQTPQSVSGDRAP